MTATRTASAAPAGQPTRRPSTPATPPRHVTITVPERLGHVPPAE
ncbi:hypothetical protein [Pseudomonas sp. GCEP-101]|nr:hypothetical protein [Pseudomonas sp. GCEP-101]